MAKCKKNLKLVEEHLQDGENVEYSIFGTYECKIMGEDSVRSGIFVATENRIVFFAKKIIGYDLESFPFENISSLEKSKGMLGHSITFFSSGNKSYMKWINKGDVDEFVMYVNSQIGKSKKYTNISNNKEVDVVAQIKKLSELKGQGVLTDEELNTKKTELLNEI